MCNLPIQVYCCWAWEKKKNPNLLYLLIICLYLKNYNLVAHFIKWWPAQIEMTELLNLLLIINVGKSNCNKLYYQENLFCFQAKRNYTYHFLFFFFHWKLLQKLLLSKRFPYRLGYIDFQVQLDKIYTDTG